MHRILRGSAPSSLEIDYGAFARTLFGVEFALALATNWVCILDNPALIVKIFNLFIKLCVIVKPSIPETQTIESFF